MSIWLQTSVLVEPRTSLPKFLGNAGSKVAVPGVIRFLIGCAGATFVTNQFWCSMMFAPNVVGTANATAAGWGNLGGGVTQIFIMWALVIPMREFLGLDNDTSWRFAMLVPAVMFFMVAATMKYCCWDMPDRKKFDSKVYKVSDPSMGDYCVCLADYRVAADKDKAENTPAPLSIWSGPFSVLPECLFRTISRKCMKMYPHEYIGLSTSKRAVADFCCKSVSSVRISVRSRSSSLW